MPPARASSGARGSGGALDSCLAQLVAHAPDRLDEVAPAGGGEPDAASIIAAIEACTGHQIELIAGKPSALMARTAMAVLGTDPADSLILCVKQNPAASAFRKGLSDFLPTGREIW